MKTIKLNIDGNEYVAVPVADYRRLTGAKEDVVPAKDFFRDLLSHNVALARKTAGLTQKGLAERMGVSQPTIAQAESGKMTISADYVERVLTACKLPLDWVAPTEEEGSLPPYLKVLGGDEKKRAPKAKAAPVRKRA